MTDDLTGLPPMESSGGVVIRNTFASGIGTGVIALVALVTTPVLITRLGPAEFGIWLLATTLTFDSGYLRLADLGFQPAAVRFIAAARSRGDDEEVSRVVATTTWFLAIAGVLLALAVAGAARGLAGLFSIAPDLEHTAGTVFALVGAQIALDLPAVGSLAVLEGSQRHGLLRTVEVGGRLAWGVAAVALTVTGGGAVALALASLAVAALRLLAGVVFARHVQPGIRMGPGQASRQVFRVMLPAGSALLVVKLLSVIYRQMDRAIIGIALTAAAVAEYEIAYKIHATAAVLLTVAPSAVVSAAAFAAGQGDTAKLRLLYIRGTRFAIGICLPVIVAVMLLARPLIRLWVGPEFDHLAGVTRLFLLYPAVAITHVVGVAILIGLGRLRPLMVLNALSVGVNLVVSLALVRRLGIAGVVWGTLAGYLVQWVPFLRLFLQQFTIGFGTWVRSLVVPFIVPAALQVAVGVVLLRQVDDSAPFAAVAGSFILLVVGGVAAFLLAVPTSDRDALKDALRRRPPASAGHVG